MPRRSAIFAWLNPSLRLRDLILDPSRSLSGAIVSPRAEPLDPAQIVMTFQVYATAFTDCIPLNSLSFCFLLKFFKVNAQSESRRGEMTWPQPPQHQHRPIRESSSAGSRRPALWRS